MTIGVRAENPTEFSPEDYSEDVRQKIEEAQKAGFDGVMWSSSGMRFFHISNPEELKGVQAEIDKDQIGGYDSLDHRSAYDIVADKGTQELSTPFIKGVRGIGDKEKERREKTE